MSQLFIGPSCLGDAIIATGLVDRMLRDFPDEPITIGFEGSLRQYYDRYSR